jgi:hypothetical protein
MPGGKNNPQVTNIQGYVLKISRYNDSSDRGDETASTRGSSSLQIEAIMDAGANIPSDAIDILSHVFLPLPMLRRDISRMLVDGMLALGTRNEKYKEEIRQFINGYVL